MAESTEKRKGRSTVIIVGTAVILGAILLFTPERKQEPKTPPYVPPGNTPESTGQPHEQPTPGLTAEERLRKDLPDPIVGTVRITTATKHVAKIKVPAGWSIRAKPVSTKLIKLTHYVEDVPHSERIVGTNDTRWECWVLEDGQGIDSVDLAIVEYAGKEPDEETWYSLAVVAGPLRGSG